MSNTKSQHEHSLSGYIGGYFLSLLLTGAAFWLVWRLALPHRWLVGALAVLAVLQLAVQLTFFLALDRERRPHQNLLAFGFAVMVVVIVAGGSLWIMHNLNYHMTTPAQTEQYLQSQDGL